MIYTSWMSARTEGMCVFLAGEVDLSVSTHLYQILGDALGQTSGPIEVNLRGLQLLDCAGIATLLRARSDAHHLGRVLYVSEPRGIVRRVLDLTGTLTLLATAPPASSVPSDADRRNGHAATREMVA